MASILPNTSSSVGKDPRVLTPHPGTEPGAGTSVPVPTLPTPPQEELQESHTAYIQQHPELQVLLSDFLLALLLQQPQDPVSFAAEFFAHREPPEIPFSSPGAANPSPTTSHPAAHRE